MKAKKSLEHWVASSMAGDDCPTSDQLADYALGLLDGNEQLTVSAHVRSCPVCQMLIKVCRPPEPQRRLPERIRTLVAQLAAPAAALHRRGDASSEQVRQYLVADIAIELLIPPPAGESWSITGQVLQNGVGLVACEVHLRLGRRNLARTSDASGYFAFTGLSSGRYKLAVIYGQIRVEINDLTLYEDTSS